MTQRAKLELPINQPTDVRLLYDEPVSGQSKYGSYHLFAVAVGDDEFSFFPNEEVYEQIKPLKKGDVFTITKLASQRGSKLVTTFEVQIPSSVIKPSLSNNPVEPLNDEMTADNFYGLMLKSYKDALSISRELNGMADPEKIAVTLFIARSKQNNF